MPEGVRYGHTFGAVISLKRPGTIAPTYARFATMQLPARRDLYCSFVLAQCCYCGQLSAIMHEELAVTVWAGLSDAEACTAGASACGSPDGAAGGAPSLEACLAGFFAPEAVTWVCPAESAARKAAAAAARGRRARRSVSFSGARRAAARGAAAGQTCQDAIVLSYIECSLLEMTPQTTQQAKGRALCPACPRLRACVQRCVRRRRGAARADHPRQLGAARHGLPARAAGRGALQPVRRRRAGVRCGGACVWWTEHQVGVS
jgi:hypothetical protein